VKKEKGWVADYFPSIGFKPSIFFKITFYTFLCNFFFGRFL
jgi:hypothetical protein